MRLERFTCGSIGIDGVTYEHDVVIDRGKVRGRRKKPSKRFRHAFGHTPLSPGEDSSEVPPTGGRYGSAWRPARDGRSRTEAVHRNVELLVLPTPRAIEALRMSPNDTNAILHVTC
jgi:hypothetical protein